MSGKDAVALGMERIQKSTQEALRALEERDDPSADEALHQVEVQARTVRSLLVKVIH